MRLGIMSRQLQIRVPKMGMDTTEVQIGRWLIKVGDSVSVGTPLVELESEKAVFTVESEAVGIVTEIRQVAGMTASIGEVLCVVNLD